MAWAASPIRATRRRTKVSRSGSSNRSWCSTASGDTALSSVGIGAGQRPKRARTWASSPSRCRSPAGAFATANRYAQPSASGTTPKRSPRPQISPLSGRKSSSVVIIRHAVYPAYRGRVPCGHRERRTALWIPSAPMTTSASETPMEWVTETVVAEPFSTRVTFVAVRRTPSGSAAARMSNRSERRITTSGPYLRSRTFVSVRDSHRPFRSRMPPSVSIRPADRT